MSDVEMSSDSTSKDRRDPRPIIYGVLDLIFAGAYALVFALVVPNRFAGYSLLLWSLVVVIAAAGVATLTRHPRAWWVACAGCALQLVLTVVLLALLVISAAFLAGVYGALGKGAAVLTLVFIALAVELFGIVPAFQLRFLLSRAGRLSFRRA